MYKDVQFFINGEWIVSVFGCIIDVVNLVIEEVIGKIVYVDCSDLDCVLEVVKKGFEIWCNMFVFECFKIMC